jgi:hypothetical protein
MPLVIIGSGVTAGDGGEERLWEYFCDYPDCPNTAERLIGYVREIAGGFAVCLRHAAVLEGRIGRDLPRVSFGALARRHELDVAVQMRTMTPSNASTPSRPINAATGPDTERGIGP